MHKRSLNYSNNAGDKEPDCAVPESFCFHFFQVNWDLNFGYTLKPHSRGGKTGFGGTITT